ncbi:MAG: sigma-70 family RNA polymerase sigma factor [Defluviitaleaceae bacterium]|nr:sigma-70 family RNA polymerase sigma factor [Defluviitaleaceae bacterium]
MIDRPDSELIAQVKQGDEIAFEHLLLRYKTLINKVVRRYYLQSYEREDFYQVGAVAFYRAVLTYQKQEDATFYSYALSCVRNEMVSLCRKEIIKTEYATEMDEITLIMESRGTYSVEKSHVLEEENNTVLHVYRTELNKLLLQDNFFGKVEQQCLEGLINGLTYEEIAKAYQFDVRNVWNAMCRVRGKLRKHGLDDEKRSRETQLNSNKG